MANFLFWRYAAECHVRAFVVVRPKPSGRVVLDFADRIEQIMRQPVITNRTVVTFYISVLLRLARLNELQFDASLADFGDGDQSFRRT